MPTEMFDPDRLRFFGAAACVYAVPTLFYVRSPRNPDPWSIDRNCDVRGRRVSGISHLMLIAGAAHLMLWVLYWVNVRELSGLLSRRHSAQRIYL